MVCCSTEDTQRNKEPWLAVNLSWLIPGCGQFYVKSYARGTIFIILAILFYIFWLASLMSTKCSIIPSLAIRLCGSIILPVFACVDAFKVAKRGNTGEFETQRALSKDSWLAVFLSLLLPGLGHAYIRKGAFFVLYAFIFLVLGILSMQAVYAVITLVLFRVLVCFHAYFVSPIYREQKKETIIVFAILVLSVGCFVGILMPWIETTYFVQGSFPTWGSSMEPTIEGNDRIIINKLAYVWNDPEVADIIALKIPKYVQIPENAPERTAYLLCKRVIAVGGETVEVKDGKVYVNGKERRFIISRNFGENFKHKGQSSGAQQLPSLYNVLGVVEPYRVPADRYFLLGDNMRDSMDSRYFGAILKEEIIGKATKIYWPLRRIGTLY